ncbi:hypothetical protein OROMI_010980 [Orobanche minor]
MERGLLNPCNGASLLYFNTSVIITLLIFYILYNPKTAISVQKSSRPNIYTPPTPLPGNGGKRCDLFKGEWIRDERGSMYTNCSCKTIPYRRNCFLHGRKDGDFVQWRWKPEECELPRFDPRMFLSIVRGKTMAFVGDSLSKNQMDSLLCLLSSEETPRNLYKDDEDHSTTWEFQNHNFTVMSLWSKFLVTATARLLTNATPTGDFNLHLDKVDQSWSRKLPLIDYFIFSDAQWFFRQHYLYSNNTLIGCTYCKDAKNLGFHFAIKRVVQSVLKHINECDNCKNIFTMLRTFSPSHFEHGEWNTGGVCNRTRPYGREEVIGRESNMEMRNTQVEEIERLRERGENRFEILDVTEMMGMRADGHPGVYGGNTWMKGYSDCIHWCLPGPIDVWNELLSEMIKRHKTNLLS